MRKELTLGPVNPAVTLAEVKVYGYVKMILETMS